MNPEYVWCEVSYKDEVDYQPLANEKGMINGKLIPKKAYLDYVPDLVTEKLKNEFTSICIYPSGHETIIDVFW